MIGQIGPWHLFTDVQDRIKRKNKILFSWDSACLEELLVRMGRQDHKTMILWALDCAQGLVEQIETRFPKERRPRQCLERCEAWSKGEIKMPEARRFILSVHGAAKDYEDPVLAALFHGVGQAGATVHTPRHAPGLAFYELTAIVLEQDFKRYEEAVLTRIQYYQERLHFWQAADSTGRPWAGFLMDKS